MAFGHSRKIEKKDIIEPLLDYFRTELEKKSINNLRDIAFQILLRENKELERKVCQVYRKIILKEKKTYPGQEN